MKIHQSYAPFGSVSLKTKKSKTKKQQIEEPGPGSYEVSFPIINPIIQTIRKKNNNVIVKLGHIGTASFQSDQQRFKINMLNMLGPGSYSPQKMDQGKTDKLKHSRHRSVAVEKIGQLIKNKPDSNKPAISEVRQIQINDYIEMPKIQHKKIANKHQQHPKGSIWSKLTQDRQIKIRSVSNIGPGQYNPTNIHENKGQCSAFKSQSIRSFFDKIYYQTNQQKIAKLRQQKKYKSSIIGPANYNVNQQHSKFYKYQFFGSTQERNLL